MHQLYLTFGKSAGNRNDGDALLLRSVMQPQPSGEKSVSVSYVERVVVVQPGETEATSR